MNSKKRSHYLLMKRKGFLASGQQLSATESARALLNVGYWPLFKQTPCKNMVEAGQKILIYLAGSERDCQQVIASASIDSVVPWSDKAHKTTYPIVLDDIPSIVLNLANISKYETPINIKEHLKDLQFVPKSNPKKWGSALMGGMKTLSIHDYNILSQPV